MDVHKRALLEAALFQASKPLNTDEIAQIVEMPEHEVEKALEELAAELRAEHRGVEIFEVDGRYEMRVKRTHAPRVSHLTPYADLSRGLLKALSLIAYRQPITQSDIVKTIGNRAYEYVKDLEGRGLVKTEKFRRTKRIELTEQFMSYFGIRSRQELLSLIKKQPETVPKQVGQIETDLEPIVDWMVSFAQQREAQDVQKTENAEKKRV